MTTTVANPREAVSAPPAPHIHTGNAKHTSLPGVAIFPYRSPDEKSDTVGQRVGPAGIGTQVQVSLELLHRCGKVEQVEVWMIDRGMGSITAYPW